MTGLDYINNYLTDNEHDVFINNVLDKNPSLSFLGTLLDAEYKSLSDMMTFSFYWEDTPEGHDFWQEIAYRQNKPIE